MHKKTAEAIYYIVLGLAWLGCLAFLAWAVYFTITNPN
jgi:ABC-type transporter Mla subunit MlaD